MWRRHRGLSHGWSLPPAEGAGAGSTGEAIRLRFPGRLKLAFEGLAVFGFFLDFFEPPPAFFSFSINKGPDRSTAI